MAFPHNVLVWQTQKCFCMFAIAIFSLSFLVACDGSNAGDSATAANLEAVDSQESLPPGETNTQTSVPGLKEEIDIDSTAPVGLPDALIDHGSRIFFAVSGNIVADTSLTHDRYYKFYVDLAPLNEEKELADLQVLLSTSSASIEPESPNSLTLYSAHNIYRYTGFLADNFTQADGLQRYWLAVSGSIISSTIPEGNEQPRPEVWEFISKDAAIHEVAGTTQHRSFAVVAPPTVDVDLQRINLPIVEIDSEVFAAATEFTPIAHTMKQAFFQGNRVFFAAEVDDVCESDGYVLQLDKAFTDVDFHSADAVEATLARSDAAAHCGAASIVALSADLTQLVYEREKSGGLMFEPMILKGMGIFTPTAIPFAEERIYARPEACVANDSCALLLTYRTDGLQLVDSKVDGIPSGIQNLQYSVSEDGIRVYASLGGRSGVSELSADGKQMTGSIAGTLYLQ